MKPSIATPSVPASTPGSALIEVSGALVIIIAVILVCAWIARRTGLFARSVSAKNLKVSASVSLGARERIVVVDVEDARLVLGVTGQQITHLHTLPPASAPDAEPAIGAASADFSRIMRTLLKGNGKK